jgi:AraC-like DNA-binding protein
VSEPHIAAPLVRNLVDAIEGRGVHRDDLLATAGVDPAALRVRLRRLPFSMVEDLLEAAEQLTGDERVGFHLSEWRDLDVMGLPAMLMVASGTVRHAIRQVMRFIQLWCTAYRLDLTDAPGGQRGRLTVLRPERRALVHLHEMVIADGALILRRLAGRNVSLVEVCFAHARDGDVGEYERYFGCRVRFGAGETAITLRDEVLDLPVPTASSLLLELFERRAKDELTELSTGRTVSERVRALLEDDADGMRLSQTSLEDIAARLRTSTRTLQRALGREGTRFAAQLETVRRGAAERLLLAGVEIAEVSFRLGYAEPAVFHRAFKRWTGTTPEGWRPSRRG